MKKFFALFAAITLLWACSETSESKENNVLANTVTEFTIEGMTCPHGCAAPIESKLSRMEGVAEAKVDFEKKTAVVSFDNTITNFEAFKAKIESLNENQYSVTKQSEEKVNQANNSSTNTQDNNDDYQEIWSTDFELPNILDFFTNII